MQKPNLVDSNLTLRLAELADIESILQFFADNSAHLQMWEPARPENFLSVEYWQKKITEAQNDFKHDRSLQLLLWHNTTKKLIGLVNFTNFERDPFQNCRLGYKIAKSFEGQGHMFAALQMGIDYIFKNLNFHRIEANVMPENARSLKLLRRLGFVEHGIAKNYLQINGAWRDHVLLSVVAQ